MRTGFCMVILGLACAGAVVGQEEIDPAHQYSWGENIGWMNWRDAGDPPGSQGVRVHASFLSGFIWSEAAGWINVGSGPAGGGHYANLDGSDFGVNIEPNGDLHGFAWGENIGWLQFDTRSLGVERARLDRGARRFRGYVWGENIGWINLDDAEHYLGIGSGDAAFFRRGDSNADADVDLADPVRSLNCLLLGGICKPCNDAGDSNDDGRYDIADPIHTLIWLFLGGEEPPDPGPYVCGTDKTEDAFQDCVYDSCF